MSVAAVVEYHKGLHLKGTPLWLDAERRCDLCFVSNAAVRGAYRHQQILSTDSTAALLRAMAAAHGSGRHAHEPKMLVTPYRRCFALGRLSLELLPAGQMLGSATLLIRYLDQAILYAGAINQRAHGQAEPVATQRCDLLVLNCGASAHRRFALPPAQRVRRQLLRFVEQTLDNDETPVLLVPPVGEAQEVIRMLAQGGHAVRAHRLIAAANGVYAERAPEPLDVGNVRHYARPIEPGSRQVLLWPLRLHRSPSIAKQPKARVAMVSPLAQDARLKSEVRCDAAFPISVEADYAGLIGFVRSCEPKRVVLSGSPSPELEADLRGLGLDVTQVGPNSQLELF